MRCGLLYISKLGLFIRWCGNLGVLVNFWSLLYLYPIDYQLAAFAMLVVTLISSVLGKIIHISSWFLISFLIWSFNISPYMKWIRPWGFFMQECIKYRFLRVFNTNQCSVSKLWRRYRDTWSPSEQHSGQGRFMTATQVRYLVLQAHCQPTITATELVI